MSDKKICVLGAGLSGISHALHRQSLGEEVTVYENNSEVGGVLQSKRINGFLLDYGANTLSLRLKKTEEFLKRYNIFENLIDANQESSKRFIIKGGKIIPLPKSILSFLTSSFLTPAGKLRLCMEPFISKKKEFDKDESMAQFVKRRLGREALDYAANPFIGGVYASRPESLLLRHAFPSLLEMEKHHGSIFFSILRGGIKREEKLPKTRLVSLKDGMQELTIRLAAKLKNSILLNRKVKLIQKQSNGLWLILSEDSNGNLKDHLFDKVISTLPSHTLKKIEWKGINKTHLIEDLASAYHPPLALTFLGFKREQIAHPLDGFGFLVPEVERMKILGTLFSSTLFPNRAPQGHILLTSFVGGERSPELSKLPENELLKLSFVENQKILGIKGKPSFEHHKIWPQSIPIPDESTDKRIEAAKLLNQENEGLCISGAHINGAPLPNCMTF
ncbi:MAG: protoporphyrinogen oxidase [Verrucomicrobiota bacterium]|nr:protoporphyrinogen oxidase [Verrucomicrobiota bacterium]